MASTVSMPSRGFGNAILAAALTLPCLQPALADQAPEHGLLSYRYLDYQDSQPGLERISVKAHALLASVPINEKWSVEGSLTADTVSGASPTWWTQVPGTMHDKRNAESLSLNHYMAHDTLGVTASLSEESDYVSRSISFTGSHNSEDKNTTFHYGIGVTDDQISALTMDRNKNLIDLLVGLTQVVTTKDIVQFNFTHSSGHGYFSDPYKMGGIDQRPDNKKQTALLARWNHHFEDSGTSLRLNYRYYRDTWGIHAHTLGAEYVIPLNDGWSVIPSMRVHNQSAADFYKDQTTFTGTDLYQSTDQRLSAFAALTVGIKVSKQITNLWSADIKYEQYRQRGDWYIGGSGTPDLAPFHARYFQVGLSRKF